MAGAMQLLQGATPELSMSSSPYGKASRFCSIWQYQWTIHCVILDMTMRACVVCALFASTMICILIARTTYSIVKFNETYLHNDPGKNDFNHNSLKNRYY